MPEQQTEMTSYLNDLKKKQASRIEGLSQKWGFDFAQEKPVMMSSNEMFTQHAKGGDQGA